MNNALRSIAILCFAVISTPSMAVQILSCEDVWAQLSKEIAGDKATVGTLATTTQDPHHISLTPHSIALAHQADLLICDEIGHDRQVKALTKRSGNARIQPGHRGYLEASQYAIPQTQRLQRQPEAGGSHHVEGDPRNILRVADVLTARLTAIDPTNAAYYRERHKAFVSEWEAAIERWAKRAAPLNGIAVIAQRNSCENLCRWLGIREIAIVEAKQGGSPNVRQMQKILTALHDHPAKMIITGPYHSSPAVSWLARETKLPVVVVPTVRDATHGSKDLYGIFDDTIDRMLAAVS